MGRLGHLGAIIILSLGAVVAFTACGGTKKAEITSTTTPVAAGTPTTEGSPPPTLQPGTITIDQPHQDDLLNVPITVSGTASVYEGALTVAIENGDGSQTFCQTTTTASEGAPGTGTYQLMLAFPPPPFAPPLAQAARVHVFSRSPKDGSLLAESIVPFKISGVVPNILIYSPLCDAFVKSPVTVSGTASVSEGQFTVDIKDSSGNTLASAHVTAPETTPATTPEAPASGDFSQDISFSLKGETQPGRIEAYSLSPKDGSVINLFSVPVMLSP